ncbi:MAG: hypothetical protein IJD39_10745 [Clostridia bacterium]|nr:hypothetical protein [Clostridia bacterium]
MEILLEIIAQCLERGDIGITIDGKAADVHAWAEGHCYQAIKKIQAILREDGLDDAECFNRIEKIVTIMEELGIDCGSRHDFG